jgi:hypothetical protein
MRFSKILGLCAAVVLGAATPALLAEDVKPDAKADAKADAKPDDSPGPVDTEGTEAQSLAKKLHVAPNWRPKKSTVDLTYTFKDEPELLDWKWKGTDKVEYAKGGPKEANAISGLEIGVASSGTALGLLDPVEFNGDFTIDCTMKALFNGGSSDLVFLVGVKNNDAIGVRWGDQLVRLKRGSVTAIGKNAPSQEKWNRQSVMTIKIVRTGDEIQTWLNKMEQPKKKLTHKELDGKIGLLLSSNLRVKIQTLKVSGGIAKP